MKNKYSLVMLRHSRRFYSCALFSAALMGLLLPQMSVAQSISMNFGSTDPNAASSSIAATSVTAGAIPVAGTRWNNHANASGSASSLIDSTGATTSTSVTWTSANTWRSGSSGGTGTSQNGILTKGYLDDSSNSHLVTVTNIPYLSYNVYFIGATDATKYSAPTINGKAYTFSGGATVPGTAVWGTQAWSNAETLVEGNIFLKVQNQFSPTLTVKGGANAGGGRGSIAAVQVENAYTGTLSYWDTDGATAGAGGATPAGNWTDANWSSATAGDATSSNWTSGNGAVFSAGSAANGTYTVTVSGTQTADVLWSQEGQVTLSGGQIDLVSGLVRGDSPFTIDSVLGGASISTVGTVVLNGTNVYTGATNVQSGTLFANLGSAIPNASVVAVNTGATLSLGAAETIGGLQGGGTVALGANNLTIHDAAANNFAGVLAGTGSVLFTGVGTPALSGGSTAYDGEITVANGTTLLLGNNANTLGTNAGPTTVQSGGTVMVASALAGYNQPSTAENFIISGTGVNGAGALSGTVNYGVIKTITLAGDASIGGTARWDIGGGGTGQQAVINGGGFTLTKVGTNNIWMRANGGVTNVAGLVINSGVFGVEFGDNALGSTPVTVNVGAAFSAWTATPTNTQGNPVILNGGTLDVDAGGVTFSGGVTLTAPSIINSDGGNMTVSGVVSESGGSYGFNKTAANTLTLTGANTYTGATNVNGGVLAVSGGSALPDNAPLNFAGGSLALNAAETVGSINGTAGGAIALNANQLTINQTTDGSIVGLVTGTGGIIKNGSANLNLTQADTYSGQTVVNGGSIRIGASHTTSDFVFAAGTSFSCGPLAGPNIVQIKSLNLAAGTSSTYRLGTNWDTLDVTTADSLVTGGTHTINIQGATGLSVGTYDLIDYNNSIGGSGYTFVLGTMPHIVATLNHNEVDTKVELVVSAIDELTWKGTIDGDWDTNSKQNWSLLSTSAAAPFFTSDNVILNDTASTGAVNVVGSVAAGTVKIDNDTLEYTLSGSGLSGTGSFIKDGPGKATLKNANTYTGLTNVLAGTLVIGDGTSGSITGALTVTAGECQVNPAAAGTFAPSAVTIAENGTLRVTGTGPMTWGVVVTNASTGALVFDRDGVVTCNIANQTAGSFTINKGIVAMDGSQINDRVANNKLVKVNAAGTLQINGVNAIPGGLVNSADVQLDGGTLQIVTGGSAVTGAGGQSHAHVRNIAMNGGTISLTYSGAGSAYNDESFQLNGTLTVGGSAASQITQSTTNVFAGIALLAASTFQVNEVVAGADLIVSAELESSDGGGGVLVKEGLGAMKLTVANSYAGGTTVNGGTLLVSNTVDSGTGSGAVTVAAAGTIGGTGIIAGATTVAGSLAPGESTGTLTFNNTLALTGTYAVEVNGATADRAQVLGVLDITGASLSVTELAGGFTASHYVIAQYGTLTGTFASVPSGYVVKYGQGVGSNEIWLEKQVGYDAWATSQLLDNTNNGAAQDPDNDGISNLLEYVLGGTPLTSSQSIVPVGALTGSNLVFTFKRSDASENDTTLKFQHATDLQTWTDVTIGAASAGIVTIDENGAADDSVTVTLPKDSDAKKFGRVIVTKP